ncbi:MAG: hypothetical protein PHY45_04325 [Rhodocyclaceae bacterium]|nr:hypothetical protein [Rhodocyclaceae bacterium]
MPVSIDNQIEIPQSFMAMYVTTGHSRPNAPQAIVLARYEQCEDMACLLTEHAQTLAFKENFAESEVLLRCHQGLLADASNFTENESGWVVLRLAELLGWTMPPGYEFLKKA